MLDREDARYLPRVRTVSIRGGEGSGGGWPGGGGEIEIAGAVASVAIGERSEGREVLKRKGIVDSRTWLRGWMWGRMFGLARPYVASLDWEGAESCSEKLRCEDGDYIRGLESVSVVGEEEATGWKEGEGTVAGDVTGETRAGKAMEARPGFSL